MLLGEGDDINTWGFYGIAAFYKKPSKVEVMFFCPAVILPERWRFLTGSTVVLTSSANSAQKNGGDSF